MYRIATYNQIAAAGIARFPKDAFRVAAELAHPEAILLRSHPLHDMQIPEPLLAVARAGAGVNNIPIDRLSDAGIAVFNTPGANANAVRELVLSGLLMVARNLGPAWQFVHQLEGDGETYARAIESAKKRFVGRELPGRALGVIGLGAIGVLVANAAQALGMRVIGHDPHLTVAGALRLSSSVEQAASLEALLEEADFVTLHVPLLDSTRHLINAERLAMMRPESVLLNFARGGIVDQKALLAALDGRRLSAYVTDFPSRELAGNERVLGLPHLGASTGEAEENCAVMAIEQLVDYLEHGSVVNSVNFPQMRLKTHLGPRLCVANRNRPDMVGQISHIIGAAGINISAMRNESRADLAYTVLDLDASPQAAALEQIQRIDGILRVRVLNRRQHA